jgi:hypothetical protein
LPFLYGRKNNTGIVAEQESERAIDAESSIELNDAEEAKAFLNLRSEYKTNKETESFSDKIRDAVVGVAGMLTFSKIQWKALTGGLVKKKK